MESGSTHRAPSTRVSTREPRLIRSKVPHRAPSSWPRTASLGYGAVTRFVPPNLRELGQPSARGTTTGNRGQQYGSRASASRTGPPSDAALTVVASREAIRLRRDFVATGTWVTGRDCEPILFTSVDDRDRLYLDEHVGLTQRGDAYQGDGPDDV